jgi:hypothetical protein
MTPSDAAPVAEANTSAASLFPARVSQNARVASFDRSRRQLPAGLKFEGRKIADNGARIC